MEASKVHQETSIILSREEEQRLLEEILRDARKYRAVPTATTERNDYRLRYKDWEGYFGDCERFDAPRYFRNIPRDFLRELTAVYFCFRKYELLPTKLYVCLKHLHEVSQEIESIDLDLAVLYSTATEYRVTDNVPPEFLQDIVKMWVTFQEKLMEAVDERRISITSDEAWEVVRTFVNTCLDGYRYRPSEKFVSVLEKIFDTKLRRDYSNMLELLRDLADKLRLDVNPRVFEINKERQERLKYS